MITEYCSTNLTVDDADDDDDEKQDDADGNTRMEEENALQK